MPMIPAVERSLYIGFDVGKVNDPAALCVLQRSRTFTPGPYQPVFGSAGAWSPWRYAVRHLERLKLGTSYPAAVARLAAICGKLRDGAFAEGELDEVVVDVTGVGRPVFDMLSDAKLGCRVVGVNYTSGLAARHAADGSSIVNLPKKDLVAGLVVLFQTAQMSIAAELPDAQVLVTELVNFQETISAAGRSSFGNDGVNAKNDDLVNCVALAAWRAVRRAPRELGASGGRLF